MDQDLIEHRLKTWTLRCHCVHFLGSPWVDNVLHCSTLSLWPHVKVSYQAPDQNSVRTKTGTLRNCPFFFFCYLFVYSSSFLVTSSPLPPISCCCFFVTVEKKSFMNTLWSGQVEGGGVSSLAQPFRYACVCMRSISTHVIGCLFFVVVFCMWLTPLHFCLTGT